jgi:hypothetical protein
LPGAATVFFKIAFVNINLGVLSPTGRCKNSGVY